MGKVNIITWMYTHSPEDYAHYPNVPDILKPETQNIYWRCVFCLFHSSFVRHGSSVNHFLFYNKPPFSKIDNVDTGKLVERFNINMVPLNIKKKIPNDYYKAVSSQFYLVDLIEQLSEAKQNGYFSEDDVFLILDSDCVFNKPISKEFVDAIKMFGCLPLTAEDSEDNSGGSAYGYSLKELKALSAEYAGYELDRYYWTGGEFFCFSGKELDKIAFEARKGMDQNLERHARGLPKFHTEEQFFGYIFAKLNYDPFIGVKFATRIYTDPKFSTHIYELDKDRIIWHMLSEKGGIFPQYFQNLNHSKIEFTLIPGKPEDTEVRKKELAMIARIDQLMQQKAHSA